MAKFQVRARTVDMLGRQQIAGIPTAISELFKNAHDAYAQFVEVDYFRKTRLFVLRDDGLGMTLKDFEDRWLTLGTESKLGSAQMRPPPNDPNQPPRRIQGEKGIGRLAIAIIGPQVLVLSRARLKGKPANSTVAAYLHWGLFELPDLNLEDINIPIREFAGGTLPTKTDVAEMVSEAAMSLEQIALSSGGERAKQIRKEMNALSLDPQAYAKFLGDPSLLGSGSGTHFYIVPADPIIDDDIDSRRSRNEAARLEKNLIGFTNTMTTEETAPPIVASFRDHRDEGAAVELIGTKAFFTPEEFKAVDHHFMGRFDEFGQFCGKVGIYREPSKDYVLNWRDSDGRATDCGPFSLSFAYMQGKASESRVPPMEHTRMRQKLDRFGGLYIYRDGIRVQPYGDSDYDWLDIERNRTLGAGYYFYSYRRMFGVVDLNQDDNWRLTEKAGREGFRENRAYRQLRSILMNFFEQTAADFFRKEGEYTYIHAEIKEELSRNEMIRRRKAKQAKEKRRQFQESLQRAFDELTTNNLETVVEQILLDLETDTRQLLSQNLLHHIKIRELIALEEDSRNKLRSLRGNFVVSKPRGVGLTRRLVNEWNSYRSQFDQLEKEVFVPAERKIEEQVSLAAEQSELQIDFIARLETAVAKVKNDALKAANQKRSSTTELSNEIADHVKRHVTSSFNKIKQVTDQAMIELESMENLPQNSTELTTSREKYANLINSVRETEIANIERVHHQLSLVSELWQKDGFDSAELAESLEEELEELKAQRDANLELAQIGMALNTISHEFDKCVGSLRNGVRRLKAWADANEDLQNLYSDISISFEHLDEYLTMFTPLDRRLHRKKMNITGKHILNFVQNLFEFRLKRHKIELNATKNFLKSSVLSYPSSIYPPFVNLVDNSIFWLQQVRDCPREITFDADGHDLLVSDNGPGVSTIDRENIFVMNFTRKPGGRGMGLHISRETLLRQGWNLILESTGDSSGATFRISKLTDSDIRQEKK